MSLITTEMIWADYLFWVKLFSTVGCRLVAGIFFTFSTFVMRALAQLKPDKEIAVMQAINITVINPWFMTAFLGTGVACLFLAIASLLKWHFPGAAYLLNRSSSDVRSRSSYRLYQR